MCVKSTSPPLPWELPIGKTTSPTLFGSDMYLGRRAILVFGIDEMHRCLLSRPCLFSQLKSTNLVLWALGTQLASPFCFLAKERKTWKYKPFSKRTCKDHPSSVFDNYTRTHKSWKISREKNQYLLVLEWFGWLSTQGLHRPLFWPERRKCFESLIVIYAGIFGLKRKYLESYLVGLQHVTSSITLNSRCQGKVGFATWKWR